MLELASVEGRSFSSRRGRAFRDETRGDLEALLAELVQKELVRPDAASMGRYFFRHQLIRDAAYESIPLPVRADLHDRAHPRCDGAGAGTAASSPPTTAAGGGRTDPRSARSDTLRAVEPDLRVSDV